jgi:hypothetical protein
MHHMLDDVQADEYDQHHGQEIEAKESEGFHPGHFHDRLLRRCLARLLAVIGPLSSQALSPAAARRNIDSKRS